MEKPTLLWIQEALSLPGIELKILTSEIAVESCQLPNEFHGDPVDCMIIATARVHDLILLTHDQKMINYGNQRYLSVIPV